MRIEDPWAPLPVAEWPDRRQSTLVGCDGWVIDDDDEGTALSAFLAGVRDFPSEIADFTRLWTVRGLLPELGLGPRIKDVADAIDAALHENPRPALLALSASRAPSQTIPALVISAGLAWANLEAAHDDAAPPWSVRSALPATLLSAADSQWSDEEVDAAVTVCGDVVSELLRGKDRFATLGRFDAGADLSRNKRRTTCSRRNTPGHPGVPDLRPSVRLRPRLPSSWRRWDNTQGRRPAERPFGRYDEAASVPGTRVSADCVTCPCSRHPQARNRHWRGDVGRCRTVRRRHAPAQGRSDRDRPVPRTVQPV